MSKRFVCDDSNPILKDWLDNVHKPAGEMAKQKLEFLEKQQKAVVIEWESHWNSLFAKMQEAGLIDKSYNRKEYGMSLTDPDAFTVRQFFIQKIDPSQNGMPDFLKNILKDL